MVKRKIKKKYSKEQWLAKALDIISSQSFGNIVIDNLVQALGVTKGSFYWHFKNRSDFLKNLISYWDDAFTLDVMDHVNKQQTNARDRLLELMMYVTKNGLARYDLSILALAHNEPQMTEYVEKVFRSRILFVAKLFAEMGCKGIETEVRSKMIVTFMSQEQNLLVQRPINKQIDLVKKVYDLLVC
jgi:AcrR family transcriptional regulator